MHIQLISGHQNLGSSFTNSCCSCFCDHTAPASRCNLFAYLCVCVSIRFDKDKGGSLDADEFKRLVRRTLRIGKDEFSDKDLVSASHCDFV
jgi:hypothetical protein